MTKVEMWPPPDWTEVVIPWAKVLESHRYSINEIYNWVLDAPGGNFHLHGKGEAHDFAFRFEDPADATYFTLNLPV